MSDNLKSEAGSRSGIMTLNIYTTIDQISTEDLRDIINFDYDAVSNFINDPFTFNIGIVKYNGKVVGFGIIRVVNEFKLALDPKISNITKARAIKRLLNSAIELAQCNEIIASITNGGEHYVNLLEKHFRFYRDSGVLTRLEK